MCSVLEDKKKKKNREEKIKMENPFNSSHILKTRAETVAKGTISVSIHPALPADHTPLPCGFAGRLPVRHPRPALLLPVRWREQETRAQTD